VILSQYSEVAMSRTLTRFLFEMLPHVHIPTPGTDSDLTWLHVKSWKNWREAC